MRDSDAGGGWVCCGFRVVLGKVGAGQSLAPNTSVGGLLGGGIHVKLGTGEVIDFHETYDLLSKYNTKAAYSSAIAAGLGAILAALSLLPSTCQ